MPFQKGHPGYKKVGTKNGTTLLKEERRARFDEKVSRIWDETIDKLPPKYIADQFIGKATQFIEITGKDGKDLIPCLSPKVQKIIDEYTHKRGETTAN